MISNSLMANKKDVKALALSLFTLLLGCYSHTLFANQPHQWQAITTTSQQTTLQSAITHKNYRIYVTLPKQPAPKTGYSVIYLLDGHLTFAIAESLANSLIQQGTIKPVVIVAIDYAEQDQWLTLRAQDYTPPHNPIATNEPLIKGEENGGGADDFIKVINTEVKPLIEQKYTIDKQQQALFGHSYGGLFTLYTAFTSLNSFQYYYAASPSIWWDNRAILRDSTQFISSPKSNNNPPAQLIISVGSLEQQAPNHSTAQRKDKLNKRSQVTNAKDLANTLNQNSSDKLTTQFYIFPEQNHGAVIPFAIQQALSHFFSEPHFHH